MTQGTKGQARDIEQATTAPPDQSKAVAKPVTSMAQEQPGRPPAIEASGAVPKPAAPEETNLGAGTREADQELAAGGVTEEQLATSNEPQFEAALADKRTAAAHADTAPAAYREQERDVIAQGHADAAAVTAGGVTGMHGARGAALANLVAEKGRAKGRDEAKRAEVAGRIQRLFDATEADVRKILDGIDPKVEAAFDKGEATARSAFESYVAEKMAAYKADRYGGWLGKLRWAKDKLLGMPAKVDEFYTAGRERYLQQMDGVISQVADIVGGDLGAAKQRIAAGKAEIATYVKSLPKDLQRIGSEASREIGDRFGALEREVEEKQDAVVDTLATKYVDARKGLDERIEALQAENRGLVDKAIGAIKAVVGTIRDLVAMLTGVLVRAAGVVGDIIKHPVEFLGNLIAGIKGGILKFKDNIVEHLRKGLMGWLFGALAEGGVELPGTFDLKGIIKLLASIFGLTWANIRNRLVRQIGERAMAVAERGVSIFQTIAAQGVGGLWELLLEKLGDVKEMILEQVKDFVVTKIITAGITWLIGLLNPAAAFIKACKLIYDVVMFFVSNAARLATFVNTVLDSMADVVRGNVGSVVNKINDVLGQMVPIIIGFFASVIGLGGIGQKIRSIIETLQKPVNKALDFVIKTGLKLAAPLIRGLQGVSGKVKAKVTAGKAWVTGKAAAGKGWVREKVAGAKGRLAPRAQPPGPAGSDAEKRRRLQAAVTQTNALLARRGSTVEATRARLPAIASQFGLKRLEIVSDDSAHAHVHAEINPVLDGPRTEALTDRQLDDLWGLARRNVAQMRTKKTEAKYLAMPASERWKFFDTQHTPVTASKVDSGPMAEVASASVVRDLLAKDSAGLALTSLESVRLQAVDSKGAEVSGPQLEMDHLLLGPSSVVKVVSVKLSPKQLSGMRSKAISQLEEYRDVALPPVTADLNARFGGVPSTYAGATDLQVRWKGGSMSLAAFRAKYLAGTAVTSIDVEGVTVGPDLGRSEVFHLAVDRTKLMQIMATFVDAIIAGAATRPKVP